jgi:hypothetical protein
VLIRMETFMDDRQIFGPEQRARGLILEKIQSSCVYLCGRRRKVASDRRIVGLRNIGVGIGCDILSGTPRNPKSNHVLNLELYEESTVFWSS